MPLADDLTDMGYRASPAVGDHRNGHRVSDLRRQRQVEALPRPLAIDDRQQNLTPAKAMGMNVILFKSAPQLRADLEHYLELQLSGA